MLNKGMGGSCFCEKEIGDYIKKAECDYIMLELGVNVMDSFLASKFYNRASYIVKSALSTTKKVAFISPYLHFRDFSENPDEKRISNEYRQVCEKIANENGDLIFIDGKSILSDISQLSADLSFTQIFIFNFNN